MFHVHNSMYLGNKSYDHNDLKRKYSHLDIFPDYNFDLKQVKLFLGQENYHLLFMFYTGKAKEMNPGLSRPNLVGH